MKKKFESRTVRMLCVVTWVFSLIMLSSVAYASQDAPNDLYAMQCVEGKCYYATGKEVPEQVLAAFEKQMNDEMVKLEKEEGMNRE